MNDRVSIINALEQSNDLNDLVLAILLRYKSDPDFEQKMINEMYSNHYKTVRLSGVVESGIYFKELRFTRKVIYFSITFSSIASMFRYRTEIDILLSFPNTKCDIIDSLIYEVCSYFRMKLKELENN